MNLIDIGEAVAEAFADTSVILEVTGEGSASGTAEAQASSISNAFAQVSTRFLVKMYGVWFR